MVRESGGHATRAMREIVAESVGTDCCNGAELCPRHERIDAQIASVRARHAWLEEVGRKSDPEVIAALRSTYDSSVERYTVAVTREATAPGACAFDSAKSDEELT